MLYSMSFRNYRMWDTCLCKCLKSHVSVNCMTVNICVRNTAVICVIVVSSVLFITLGNFSWEKSFLVISNILKLFLNIFTPDKIYCLCNRENLLESVQIKLSKKLKIFSRSFTVFLKSIFNFKHFKQKDEFDSLCLSEIIDC